MEPRGDDSARDPLGLRAVDVTSSPRPAPPPVRRWQLLPDDPRIGWTPYAYLIYLTPFLAYPLTVAGFTRAEWLAHVAGTITFLGLYFYGYWVSGRERVPVVVAITLLGVLFMPENPGGACFFMYAAAFTPELGTPRVAARWLAGLVLVIAAEGWLLGLRPWVYVPAMVFVPMIGGLTVHYAELARKNARLRLAQEEVTRLAQVAERERIGRDLHDLLGHTLSVIVLKADLAGRLAERDLPRALAEIRDLERISRDALAEVRNAVRGYHMSGLHDELARARETLGTAGVETTAHLSPVDLPPVEDHALALVLRESVTNILRHARATRCDVTLSTTGTSVSLVISDNGRGTSGTTGHGIDGMRTRIEELGGRLDVSGGAGTRVAVTIPARSAIPDSGEVAS